MAKALEKDERNSIINILNEVTKTTDELSKSINDPVRSTCENMMNSNKISAWKVMGAGGGGAVALLSNEGNIEEVKKECELAGWMIIDWLTEDNGVLIEIS